MDLLFKRYASPFPFLNGMIQTNQFANFVDEFITTINKERQEKHNWEFFLHRVFDKSYKEFITEIKVTQDNQQMSDSFIETTVQNSMNILGNFNPTIERGET
jgi:hypothetical protein